MGDIFVNRVVGSREFSGLALLTRPIPRVHSARLGPLSPSIDRGATKSVVVVDCGFVGGFAGGVVGVAVCAGVARGARHTLTLS
jgi:hypothetical protein